MTSTPAVPNPSLYEIDARAWLDALGHKYMVPAPLTLDRIPGSELDRIKERGFDWVWLLGVWRTGQAGLEISRSNPDWVRHYRDILPDYRAEDVAGSMFAIQAYEVSASLGGDEALSRLRDRLRRRGLRLMLDFVPNHTARDHPWVHTHPEFYIQGDDDDLAREPGNFARAETLGKNAVLAFGRDPYSGGWTDTFQLNLRHPALREAMIAELVRIAGLCDGLRCDMAMLVLPDVIRATWGDRGLPKDGRTPDDSPFWPPALAAARRRNPALFFLAEAYWDREWTLQQQGFDATYDKTLYDRLRSRDAAAVRGHLHADPGFQRRSARFLENHDEERAAAAFPDDVHRAAAVVAFFVPGLRLFHQGQLEGRKVRPSVHLGRRPNDPTDPILSAFYDRLLAAMARAEPRTGTWRLLECREAWPGNPTWDRFIAFSWEGPGARRLLVTVNFGPTQGQCYVATGAESPNGKTARLRDLMGPVVYDRDLSQGPLYLDLPAWGYHVFAVEKVGAGVVTS